MMMSMPRGVLLLSLAAAFLGLSVVRAGDPYLFFTWNVSYGIRSPLGVPQKVILINDEFPGPNLNTTTNNNVVINVFNNIDESFLFTWYGQYLLLANPFFVHGNS